MHKRHALLALVVPAPACPSGPSFWSDDGVRAEAYASKDDAARIVTISIPAELGPLVHEVNEGNAYAGQTVRLASDIDLSGHVRDPIGQAGDSFGTQLRGFAGAFDGQGHTISNMSITADKSAPGDAGDHRYGLFGSSSTWGPSPPRPRPPEPASTAAARAAVRRSGTSASANPDDLLPATGDPSAPVALVALAGGLLVLSGAAARRRRG